jgi:hypothetical protein
VSKSGSPTSVASSSSYTAIMNMAMAVNRIYFMFASESEVLVWCTIEISFHVHTFASSILLLCTIRCQSLALVKEILTLALIDDGWTALVMSR